jgi:hypothetical protein
MTDENTGPGAAPEDSPVRTRRSWQVAGLIVLLSCSAIGTGIYLVRQAPPAPELPARAAGANPPSGGRLTPPVSSPATGTGEAKPGVLGIAKTQCQGFADIAARFWDLKSEGRTLEFAFGVIDRNSAGDEKKQRVLKALAQVVYKNSALTRDAAYRNAFAACLKQ